MSEALEFNFLIELGTEELPPKSLKKIIQAWYQAFCIELKEANITFVEGQYFASPRRLAIFLNNVANIQATKSETKRGPAVAQAYDADGNPTKATLGFAKSCGVDVKELSTLETDKGAWLSFEFTPEGKSFQSLLPEIIKNSLKKLPIAKRMRWGDFDEEFIRPVHWIASVYGNQTTEKFTLFNCESGQSSYGHRFLSTEPVLITDADSYEQSLEQAYVMADFDKRRQLISASLQRKAEVCDASVDLDQALLDEVTALVEWPAVLAVNFDPKFLEVPKEALVSAMKSHQKSFPLLDKKSAKLLPHFLIVSNMQAEDYSQIIAGNEKVMHARLADAEFFFKQDKKQSLAERGASLKTIVFQQQLGSLADKTARIEKLSQTIMQALNADPAIAQKAAQLAKADLCTEMVGEFPELQGVMGYYYALNDGEDEATALAIKQHYYPRFAGDELPESNDACALALADRLDTLVGIFGIGKLPKGDKDPFGLRRAAIGILRIIIEKQLDLNIDGLVEQARNNYPADVLKAENITLAKDFIWERLKYWYQEQGYKPEQFAAVYAQKPAAPLDFHQRMLAVKEFMTLEQAEALAAANKRVSNILSKSKINAADSAQFSTELLSESAEVNLFAKLEDMQQQIAPLLKQRQYADILKTLSQLREPVDEFFDKVMVMAEDEKLKTNRILLLSQLRQLFLEVADISKL